MTAYEFLKTFPYLPSSAEGRYGGRPSNSEVRRWLINRAVIINKKVPQPNDKVNFPIKRLIFFPKGKRKTTMMDIK